MHIPIVPLLLLIGFFLTPAQMAQEMVKKTAIDLPRIEVKGYLEGTPATPVTIVYDRTKDEIVFTVGTAPASFIGDKIPAWLRLFFPKNVSLKPPEQADALLSYLKGLGIDLEKKMLSTAGPEGDLTVVIGRESATANTPHIALYRTSMLPFRLSAAGIDVRFGDYHKSVLPLAFPGRIELTDNGSLTIYSFVRNEYR